VCARGPSLSRACGIALLEWTAAGVEGLCFKRLEESYRGGVRSWRKYKARVTTEAVIGAVTGPLAAPRTLLLGRYDPAGRLQYVGRSTTLSRAAGRAVADQLAPLPSTHGAHPWKGWTFSAGSGTERALDAVLVQPDVVMEVGVGVDVARDAHGRWCPPRTPARPPHRSLPHRTPS
jgi:ATP-dependent DNA ligase